MAIPLAARGHEVSVFARGATLAALRQRPWRLIRESGTLDAPVVASDDAAALGPQDVLLIAVKGPALETVAPVIRPMIGPHTVVVPAMNGVPWWFMLAGGGELPPTPLRSVDRDGIIAESIPFERVLGCVVHASARGTAPGEVTHTAGNRLIVGEPTGGASDRARHVADAFADAGFAVETTEVIRHEIWYKLWGNMTMNPISALTGATCDRIHDDPLVYRFVLDTMAEAQAIGSRIGCEIAERAEDRVGVTRLLGRFKTSMLYDVEAGRPIELDQLLAAPAEIARLLEVETPNLDVLLGLTRLFARSHGLYPADEAEECP
jgi:2-dehydropantoate 2-reductase